MEIQELKVFVAVAEELHFGRAAERLHLAQPPVSRTIKALEREMQVTLFERTTRSVALTAAGEALLAPARRILSELRQAVGNVQAAQNGELGRVRIAFAGASTHVMVGRLSRAARIKYPGLSLELSSQNYARPALARVINGDADISIGRWDHIPKGIHSRLLVDERLMVAVPTAHEIADRPEISMASLASQQFVTLPPHPGSVLTDRLTRLSHGAGFDPSIAQEAPDTWTALSLVAAEVGIHLTISSVAENVIIPGVRFVSVADVIDDIQLRMAWKTDSKNPALSTVLDLAEELIAQ